MAESKKMFYLQIGLFVCVLLILFLHFRKSGNDTSFNDAFNDAKTRLQNIEAEISKSTALIHTTQIRLDSIEKGVALIRIQQTGSNKTVVDIDEDLRKKVQLQQARINSITRKYNEIQKEKIQLSAQSDSIAANIQKD